MKQVLPTEENNNNKKNFLFLLSAYNNMLGNLRKWFIYI